MEWRQVRHTVVAAVFLLGLAGCGGGTAWDTSVLPWIHDIQGTYQAETVVGDWGRVALQLERVGRSRVYDAALANPQFDFFRTREGQGTLANDHVILNFDQGLDTDFYFEGTVILDNDTVKGISGQFIFPDQSQPALPAMFYRL